MQGNSSGSEAGRGPAATKAQHARKASWHLPEEDGKNLLAAGRFLNINRDLPQMHNCLFSKLFANIKGVILTSPLPFSSLSQRCAGQEEESSGCCLWQRDLAMQPLAPSSLLSCATGCAFQKPLLAHQEQLSMARAKVFPLPGCPLRWGFSSSSKTCTSCAPSPAPSPGGCSVPPRIRP